MLYLKGDIFDDITKKAEKTYFYLTDDLEDIKLTISDLSSIFSTNNDVKYLSDVSTGNEKKINDMDSMLNSYIDVLKHVKSYLMEYDKKITDLTKG